MVAVPGSEMLGAIYMLYPKSSYSSCVGLLVFMLYAIISGLISEYTNRIRVSTEQIEQIITDISNPGHQIRLCK